MGAEPLIPAARAAEARPTPSDFFVGFFSVVVFLFFFFSLRVRCQEIGNDNQHPEPEPGQERSAWKNRGSSWLPCRARQGSRGQGLLSLLVGRGTFNAGILRGERDPTDPTSASSGKTELQQPLTWEVTGMGEG